MWCESFLHLILRFIRHIGRWNYSWNRWITWPQRSLGKLVLDKGVKLYVPLRCDGEGKVMVSKGTKLGGRTSVRYGNGAIFLQARTPDSQIFIGKNCAFSNNVSIIAVESVTIGDNCLIGDMVSIMDSDFHGIALHERRSGAIKSEQVIIEDNVWLGSRVIVQKGVRIGTNSIITPNAVVISSVPSNTIAGGIPARVIRNLRD